MYGKCCQCKAVKMHVFPKMLLHNRNELVRFDQIFENGNFHLERGCFFN